VQPDEVIRAAGRLGEARDRERGGRAGEDRPVRRGATEAGEDLRLRGLVLRDRLDDERRVAQRGRIVRDGHVAGSDATLALDQPLHPGGRVGRAATPDDDVTTLGGDTREPRRDGAAARDPDALCHASAPPFDWSVNGVDYLPTR
jgi:hypothetical protein